MTQEDKELLLKDLSARLPYGVKVHINSPIEEQNSMELFDVNFASGHIGVGNKKYTFRAIPIIDDEDETKVVKPYLRPLSSMTKKEWEEYNNFMFHSERYIDDYAVDFDWLNTHHFDYRGLIEKGLALEAPGGMYNIKEE